MNFNCFCKFVFSMRDIYDGRCVEAQHACIIIRIIIINYQEKAVLANKRRLLLRGKQEVL